MRRLHWNPLHRHGFLVFRALLVLALCLIGAVLGFISLSASPAKPANPAKAPPRQTRHGSVPGLPGRALDSTQPGTPEGLIFLSSLDGVTCVSADDCWAVGSYHNGSHYQPLFEHWDGRSWSVFISPGIGSDSSLSDIHCLSSVVCWSVGARYDQVAGRLKTLIERWNGFSWSIVDSPNATTFEPNQLNTITCNSAADCWAVGQFGQFFYEPYQRTLIQHWNGSAWSIVSSPNVSAFLGQTLTGVSCASPTNCWAVGRVGISHASGQLPARELIERWDGSSWSIVDLSDQSEAPRVGRADSVEAGKLKALTGVTCLSPSECWAAGWYHFDTPADPLFAKWDGSSWVPYFAPHYTFGSLCDVTCISGSDCWAVGGCGPSDESVFVEHWDGTAWSIVEAPDPEPASSRLSSISCPSPTDCWAVGWTFRGGIIEHWDGQSWTMYDHPAPHLTSVVSRKVHGAAGVFDVDLLGSSIECRSGGPNNDYRLVFTFQNDLASVGGAISYEVATAGHIGPNPNQYTVDLTGVVGFSSVTVMLGVIVDSAGNFGGVSATMPVLVGDTNGNGVVNSADVAQTKSQGGEPVTIDNFRSDVNANGTINASDTAIVKSKIGSALP